MHAAADADLTGDEQDVVDAHGRTPPVLGEDAQVAVVGDRDRDAEAQRAAGVSPPSGTSRQPRFGATSHEPVRLAHHAGDRHADADERPAGPRAHRRRDAGEVGHDIVDGEVAAGAIDPDLVEHLAAEPDDRGGHRVDDDLDREDDHGPVGDEADDRRRPPRRALWHGRLLGDEVRCRELADESADRAAGEPGRRDEVRPRLRALLVEAARTMARRLARRTVSLRWPSSTLPLRTGLCSSLANLCQTRTQHGRVSSHEWHVVRRTRGNGAQRRWRRRHGAARRQGRPA